MMTHHDPYVLIVDDDPHTRTVFSALVRTLGFRAEVARDGEEALAFLSKQLPGFLVLDLLMPNMDGFNVLGRLKLDPEKRTIPILVITGYSIDKTKERELRALVLDVVRKGDMDMDEIGKMIDGAMKRAE
jgi:CheY-like chemotaxis protein